MAVMLAVSLAGVEAHADAPTDVEQAVQQAVRRHVEALNAGDVVTLRNSACGAVAEDFRDFGPLSDLMIWWEGPGRGRRIEVERFTDIRVSDQTAVADTELRTSSAPGSQNVGFRLELGGNGWQVCSTDRPIP
ncbi:Rv0361 family membrane protein [Nocardia heshunensis]